MIHLFKTIKVHVQRMVLITILCLITGNKAFAQSPNWFVEENNFEYTMTFLAFLTIDGDPLESLNDKVAVFVNDEVRGTCNLTYVENQDSYFAYLTAFSNSPNEKLTIKVYDSENDKIRDITTSFNFEINQHQGTLFQPISWADPVLNTEAEIITFGFDNVSIFQETIENSIITLVIDDSFDISALTPVFSLSNNAYLFKDAEKQTSNLQSVDFTNPLNYQIQSEDKSTLNNWTIRVIQISNDIIYRKRNAICSQNGAIKISSNQNGQQILLLQNDEQLDLKTIINGEALFEELEIGTYTIQIGNLTKDITINLNTK